MSDGKAGSVSDDNLVNSFADLQSKQWYSGPSFDRLDEDGRQLYLRTGDLMARLCLNGEAMWLFDIGNRRGACILVHAERYLADRKAYQLAPWPKNMMKIER